ncbi:hypothetical protein [Muricomes intestini]|uniref:hypothetical protein n=1 Tax=Muricomes intestini TaxID=1796634 RepID=UPI002FE27B6B
MRIRSPTRVFRENFNNEKEYKLSSGRSIKFMCIENKELYSQQTKAALIEKREFELTSQQLRSLVEIMEENQILEVVIDNAK